MPNNQAVISAFKEFCSYFIRYRYDNLYKNLSNNHIGGFKKRNAYKLLFNISKIELNMNNFKQFFIAILNNFDYDSDDASLIFSHDNIGLVQDFLDFDMNKIGAASSSNNNNKLDNNDLEILKKFLDSSSAKYDEFAIINETFNTENPQIIRNTQDTQNNTVSQSVTSGQVPSTQQILSLMNNDLNNSNNDTSSRQSSNAQSNIPCNFEELLEKAIKNIFVNSIKDQVDASIHDKLASELHKHLGINRNLTSEDIEKYQMKLAYTWNQFLRKENTIKNIQTHLDQNTAPFELRFFNFPVPLLPHDAQFVDTWNNLISKWRAEALTAYKKRLEEQKSLLDNDFKIIKDILKNRVSNIDNFTTLVKENEEKVLKNEFDALNKKVLDAKLNPGKNECKYKVKSKEKQSTGSNSDASTTDKINNKATTDKNSKKSKANNNNNNNKINNKIKNSINNNNNNKNVSFNNAKSNLVHNTSSFSSYNNGNNNNFTNHNNKNDNFYSNFNNNNYRNKNHQKNNNQNNRRNRFNQYSRRNFIRKSTSFSGVMSGTGRSISRENFNQSAHQNHNRSSSFLANARSFNSYR
jgi:hypothetical protein